MARHSLAEVFDPKANSLNFIRLVLAAGVIFWHAFPLSGAEVAFDAVMDCHGHCPTAISAESGASTNAVTMRQTQNAGKIRNVRAARNRPQDGSRIHAPTIKNPETAKKPSTQI